MVVIYTSYFANLKNIPSDIVPISICGKAPDWYTGLQYKKLAPKYDFFMKWKETHDNDFYIKCFEDRVLSATCVNSVIKDLYDMARQFNPNFKHICLICYEKPSDFCHRHLVAKWLQNNGIQCKEFSLESYKSTLEAQLDDT